MKEKWEKKNQVSKLFLLLTITCTWTLMKLNFELAIMVFSQRIDFEKCWWKNEHEETKSSKAQWDLSFSLGRGRILMKVSHLLFLKIFQESLIWIRKCSWYLKKRIFFRKLAKSISLKHSNGKLWKRAKFLLIVFISLFS